MITTKSHPHVATYHMMKPLRQNHNLMEVPNLLHTPEQYHELYARIRQCRYIQSFEQRLSGSIVYLQLHLRDGETCNHIVKYRIANLFKNHKASITEHGTFLIVELKG